MSEEPRVPQRYWEEIGQLYIALVVSLREAAARQLGPDARLAHDIVQEAFHDAALCWTWLQSRGSGARAEHEPRQQDAAAQSLTVFPVVFISRFRRPGIGGGNTNRSYGRLH